MTAQWVFGYGSLMWDHEEYHPLEIKEALLTGAHRQFNRQSTGSFGTKERPGISLGLDRGGACNGLILLIEEENIQRIDGREGVPLAYRKLVTPCDGLEVTADGSIVSDCVVYYSNPQSVNYIGNLPVEELARRVANADMGKHGRAIDYVLQTREGCQRMGIVDSHLEQVYAATMRLMQPTP